MDKTKATFKARGLEHADFLEEQADYTLSVNQIGPATENMKSVAQDVAQCAALMQVVRMPQADEKTQKTIPAYLAKDLEDVDVENLAVSSPEAVALEFQPQGIIDLFKKLQDKFEAQLADTHKYGMDDKYESELYLVDLED